jgi:starch synthase
LTIHSPVEGSYDYYEDQTEGEVIDWSDDFFDFKGLIKEGLDLADGVNTVSEAYAKDINSQFACNPIVGIANGIDFDLWNPQKDRLLVFRLKDGNWPEFKARNKIALQQAFDLPLFDWPLFCFVSRLSEQKGIDLLIDVLPQFLGENQVQLIVVGQGRKKYHQFFKRLKREFPAQMGLKLKADFALPHQVFAGADFLVLPSKAEPGGIVVQEAACYGCLPLVRLSGGLKDQVQDGINGLGFIPFSPISLEEKLAAALRLWQAGGIWWLRKRARENVRNWDRVAKDYLEWFNEGN